MTDSIAPDLQAVVVQLDSAEAARLASQIFAAMNAAQSDGDHVDNVIAATAYALGSAIAQRGAILRLDQPLQIALPPLALGYEDSRGDHLND